MRSTNIPHLNIQKYIYLLALAYTPKSCKSILDWRPFRGGDKLNDIIEKHNIKCITSYVKRGWLLESIQKFAEGISVVLHDFNSVIELQTKDISRIRVLLVDLEAIDDNSIRILEKIKARMDVEKQYYYIVQVCDSQKKVSSITKFFKNYPIIPSQPEILSDQKELEAFLCRLCKYYQVSLIAMPPFPPTSDPKKNREYVKIQRDTAAKVRDVAIMKNLSINKMERLTLGAIIQESALLSIMKQVGTRKRYQVVLDAIREPIAEMSIVAKIPDMQQYDLVKIRPTRTIRGIPSEQHEALLELGIRKENYITVHFDEPKVWDRLENLKGIVNATKFSGTLPSEISLINDLKLN